MKTANKTRIQTDGVAPAAPSSKIWAAVGLLVVAVGGAYANSFHGPFVLDDTPSIVENQSIRHLGSTQVLAAPPDAITTAGRPVVNLSLAVNYSIGGLAVEGYHVLNLAIHIFAALALLHERPASGNILPMINCATALVFVGGMIALTMLSPGCGGTTGGARDAGTSPSIGGTGGANVPDTGGTGGANVPDTGGTGGTNVPDTGGTGGANVLGTGGAGGANVPGTGGSSIGSICSGRSTCTGTYAPCGGDPTGTWNISSSCADANLAPAADAALATQYPSCAGSVKSADYTLRGTVTYDASNTVTYNTHTDITTHGVFSQACIASIASQNVPTVNAVVCTLLASGIRNADPGSTATCSPSGSNCACAITRSTANTSSDTYVVLDSTITEATGGCYEFCVKGSTMIEYRVSSDYGAGTATLTKQ